MFTRQQIAPAFQHASKLVTDPDDFANALSNTTLKVDFLTRQFIPARIERFQSKDWSLDMGTIQAKARASAALPRGWGSLGLLYGSGSSIWHGLKTAPAALVCNPPGGDGPNGQVMPGFAWTAIGVPIGLWENCQVLGGAEVLLSAKPSVRRWQLPPPLFAALAQQLGETRDLLASAIAMPGLACFADRAALSFVTNIATRACECAAGDHRLPVSNRSRNGSRLAHRAEAWMRDRMGEPIRIPDLCLALSVSRRELEYAFRNTFDISPQNFLNKLRLNAIHRVLLRAGPSCSITRVAFDYGIVHLGRFAAAYYRLFRERPSETLRTHSFPAPRNGQSLYPDSAASPGATEDGLKRVLC
jgi:AraC-like DNA-binding protein